MNVSSTSNETSKRIDQVQGSGIFDAANEIKVKTESEYLNRRYGSAILRILGGSVHASLKRRGQHFTFVNFEVVRVEGVERHPNDTYSERAPFRVGEELKVYSDLQSEFDRDLKSLKLLLAAACGGHPDQIDGAAFEACFHDDAAFIKDRLVHVKMAPRETADGRVFYNPVWGKVDAKAAGVADEAVAVAFG